MYTLLIIDMQPQFKSSKKCLPEVLHLISKAKKDNANILNVEYAGDGLSYPSIRKELRFYENSRTIKKRRDAGGSEVFSALEKMNWLDKAIFTCGVNSDCCIPDTLCELIECFEDYKINQPSIFVIQKACNSNISWIGVEEEFPTYCFPKEIKMIEDEDLFSIEVSINRKLNNNF